MFFNNVKIMIWANRAICVVHIKYRCPSNSIKNKTPYEMWHGHIPSMKNLRVFGSNYYSLIPKEQRNKLGARSCKCFFLGYSNTFKEYCRYDEVNKMFIMSRDVIFLESCKAENVIEHQFDHLDRFRKEKYFQEFDNKIPHLEGWIPILDQSVESFSEALPPQHEAPTTDDTLSDVIDRFGRLNLASTLTQSTEQLGPSQKGPPKWLTKTLESLHPDEIGKTGTRSTTRQNGGDVDDFDRLFIWMFLMIVNQIFVHILSQLPSNKPLLMMNGKKQCRKNMMPS